MFAPHESFRLPCSANHSAWKGSEMADKRVCSIDGCGKPVIARGWCTAHWTRWKRHGSPEEGGKPIPKAGTCVKWLYAHATFAGDECLPWPFSKNVHGYGKTRHFGSNMSAPRAMCILAHGEPPAQKHHAAHSCGNRICVNPKHLRWATAKENEADKVDHDTRPYGERHSMAKLTEDNVREIRKLQGKMFLREAADMYGVTLHAIHRIWQRKTWAWLE